MNRMCVGAVQCVLGPGEKRMMLLEFLSKSMGESRNEGGYT